MTHRPALEALVCAIDVPPREAMDLIADYRAEVAHELAEKVRAAGCQEVNWCGCPIAADLIDPKSETP